MRPLTDLRTHAAFRRGATVVPMSGFSGALVGLLALTDGSRRVRKAAALPEDSARLRRQAERQRHVGDLLAGVAAVPEVINEGVAEECYWFDMEYVAGIDAVRYLGTASPAQAATFLAQIRGVIDVGSDASPRDATPIDLRAAIGAKLDEIDARTGRRHLGLTRAIRARLGELDFTLPRNFAHGDLTLENILVDRRHRIWLIDAIDSPFDHYWIDLAKLFQDLEGRWFQRHGRSLSLGVTWTLRQRLMGHALERDARYGQAHAVLLALTFARILPYCRAETDVDFVAGKAASALAAGPPRVKETSR